MGEIRDARRILAGRSEGKRPFEKPKGRREDNIETEPAEIPNELY
jgi:hypothetical protein